MKIKACVCFLFLLFAILAGCGQRKTDSPRIEDVLQEKEDTFTCSFEGTEHRFLLGLPAETDGAPLVLMLPGYGNTAEAFRLQTEFEKDAALQGYAVAYVTGAPDPNTPTSSVGWNSEAGIKGNNDVKFLTELARYLQDMYTLDKTRTYAVGFSNGAFMIHRLAMETKNVFAAYVSVAGLMQKSVWEERQETNAVGFFQITGEKDDVVPKKSDGSAAYAKSPAIEDVMEYWAASNGLNESETDQIGNGSVLTKYKSNEKSQQVWHLVVSGGRHSWPNERYHQININKLILEFLNSQRS